VSLGGDVSSPIIIDEFGKVAFTVGFWSPDTCTSLVQSTQVSMGTLIVPNHQAPSHGQSQWRYLSPDVLIITSKRRG